MTQSICEGKGVRLRLAALSDASLIAAWKRDPLIVEMALGKGAPATEEGQRADIERALGSDSELYCVIEVEKTGLPVGYVRINWMDEERRMAWLRFALGAERGAGRAAAALKAFLGYLFAGGAHRVEAEVYEINEASLHLLEKLGFVIEGRKRSAHETSDGWVDVMVLGLLASDYEARAAGNGWK